MFAKDKVSQSLVDAVNKVLGEDKTETKVEPKQPESTPQNLNEGSNVKIQTSTGTKVLGHRYGNSAKTHRELMADPFAGAKGPKSGELEKIEKEKKKERSMDEELKGNQSKIDKNHNNKIDAQDFKILRGQKKTLTKMKEELDEPVLDELINEVLSKDASAYDWIHDFVHSDNPKFAGKSKAKRKEMALAAYYAKQRNEEVEQIDELSKSTLGSYVKKAASDAVVSRKIGTDFEHRASRAKSASMKGAATSLSDKFNSMARKRKSGIGKAVDRLTKEEVEQIDEQTPWDDGKGPVASNFKKPNNPKRTGMDTARALAQKAMKRLTGGSDKDQLNRLRKNMYGEEKESSEQPKRKRTTDTLAGRVEGGLDNQHSSYKVSLKAEEKKPLSMAKEVAKKAYKKLKTETMMGKISN